jgi:hypothetical protein
VQSFDTAYCYPSGWTQGLALDTLLRLNECYQVEKQRSGPGLRRLGLRHSIPPDLVVNASPAAEGNQATLLHQIGELTVRRGAAGARQTDVLARVHARPGIEQDIDDLALTLVERRSLVAQPEPGLGEHVLDRALGQIAGGSDLLEKPPDPAAFSHCKNGVTADRAYAATARP